MTGLKLHLTANLVDELALRDKVVEAYQEILRMPV